MTMTMMMLRMKMVLLAVMMLWEKEGGHSSISTANAQSPSAYFGPIYLIVVEIEPWSCDGIVTETARFEYMDNLPPKAERVVGCRHGENVTDISLFRRLLSEVVTLSRFQRVPVSLSLPTCSLEWHWGLTKNPVNYTLFYTKTRMLHSCDRSWGARRQYFLTISLPDWHWNFASLLARVVLQFALDGDPAVSVRHKRPGLKTRTTADWSMEKRFFKGTAKAKGQFKSVITVGPVKAVAAGDVVDINVAYQYVGVNKSWPHCSCPYHYRFFNQSTIVAALMFVLVLTIVTSCLVGLGARNLCGQLKDCSRCQGTGVGLPQHRARGRTVPAGVCRKCRGQGTVHTTRGFPRWLRVIGFFGLLTIRLPRCANNNNNNPSGGKLNPIPMGGGGRRSSSARVSGPSSFSDWNITQSGKALAEQQRSRRQSRRLSEMPGAPTSIKQGQGQGQGQDGGRDTSYPSHPNPPASDEQPNKRQSVVEHKRRSRMLGHRRSRNASDHELQLQQAEGGGGGGGGGGLANGSGEGTSRQARVSVLGWERSYRNRHRQSGLKLVQKERELVISKDQVQDQVVVVLQSDKPAAHAQEPPA
ncbi:hypothetical protein CBR_g9015 [Chara braunii]|uniref:Uncharacterized protein n=1 Tax=Chara braunii TaxID=69332 RepID=A0A388KNG5_CHABU|nr:hypothetical protein CBR_g9015 [Chara braunii]|eukprot:GBG71599.1 hypothetical protein CBR_g9015 [Chara braunii]